MNLIIVLKLYAYTLLILLQCISNKKLQVVVGYRFFLPSIRVLISVLSQSGTQRLRFINYTNDTDGMQFVIRN